MPRYFEEYEVGDTWEFGERTITKEEIIEFAEKYDPQPFHTDEEAAKDTMFGGLAASGWHTAAVCMRMYVDHMIDEASQGARGVDELRWIKPVRPGDTLTAEVEIVDKYPDEDNPQIGYVDSKLTAYNQNGEAVISWIGLGIVDRKASE
ncbi:acyl dehydratase [Halovenus sp. WSH3]|uniref:Acyl dehydratase n=1 Tax=Halovenus carboxidivorans TaxID=2692199 RepID=A0A6B0T8M8_9EURY|nr:MaoC family dehydratase [Halovenus carboxidivorans]MXR51923.1 acyl dehydratase [Halovenus carboxidivorans]